MLTLQHIGHILFPTRLAQTGQRGLRDKTGGADLQAQWKILRELDTRETNSQEACGPNLSIVQRTFFPDESTCRLLDKTAFSESAYV